MLTDVERIAPCMPGAQLQEVEGDEYRGIVKVKVGPITAQYKGKATFIESDEAGHRPCSRPRVATRVARATPTPRSPPRSRPTATAPTVDGRHRPHDHRARSRSSAAACWPTCQRKLLGQFVECLEATCSVEQCLRRPTSRRPALPAFDRAVCGDACQAGRSGGGSGRSSNGHRGPLLRGRLRCLPRRPRLQHLGWARALSDQPDRHRCRTDREAGRAAGARAPTGRLIGRRLRRS